MAVPPPPSTHLPTEFKADFVLLIGGEINLHLITYTMLSLHVESQQPLSQPTNVPKHFQNVQYTQKSINHFSVD